MNIYLMAVACPITTETQMFEQADKIGKREIVVSLGFEDFLFKPFSPRYSSIQKSRQGAGGLGAVGYPAQANPA